MKLPEVDPPPTQDIRSATSICCVQSVFSNSGQYKHVEKAHSDNMRVTRERIRSYVQGNMDSHNPKVTSLVSRIESRLRASAVDSRAEPCESERASVPPVPIQRNAVKVSSKASLAQSANAGFSEMDSAEALFSTHDTWGIIDTGATKTVIGSEHVPSFLQGLLPEIRKQVRRCRCDVVFRFGNQGTLKSEHAIMVPVGGLGLKIAVVPGATPFLLSNTLLRALGAVVDTASNALVMPKHGTQVQLALSPKGLYLLDLNKLIQAGCQEKDASRVAETFAQDSFAEESKILDSLGREENVQKAVTGSKVQVSSSAETQHHMSCQETILKSSNMPNNPLPCNPENNQSKFVQNPKDHQPQSNPIVSQVIAPCEHHERVDPPSPEGPSSPLSQRGGSHRSHSAVSSERRENVVWQGPCRKDLHGGVDVESGVDQVFPSTLRVQQEAVPSENDSLHQVDDRGNRDSWRRSSAITCATRQPCHSQGHGDTSQSQSNADDIQSSRRFDSRGDTVGAVGRAVRDSCSSSPHGKSGECLAPDPAALGARAGRELPDDAHRRGMERSLEQLMAEMTSCDSALTAGEVDTFGESNLNKERLQFWKTVDKIEKEMSNIISQTRPLGKPIDLLEVFCSENSNLTNQVNALGGRAMRFGLCQGDLHTEEGRAKLFQLIGRHQPRNLWMSPVCKPWSCWSQFNSQRSVESWDKIHADRQANLIQVALCLALCRYQVRLQRHAHWEQPKGSLMMSIPYVQEIYRYLKHAYPDLCVAGDLKDPVNHMSMKKGLHIATSSCKLFDELDSLRCHGHHQHQQIEGSTRAFGQTVSRSTFSEWYPRRFARRVARIMMKNQYPKEKPFSSLCDPALVLLDAVCAAGEREAKRQRMSAGRSKKSQSADRQSDSDHILKKPKTMDEGKDASSNTQTCQEPPDQAHEIMQKIEKLLPRVGRKVFDQPDIKQAMQEMFPEKIIKCIVACKGTERTLAPPEGLNKREAPFRRAIMKLRSNGSIIMEPEWEKHDTLSQRKIVRKSLPCRVNITVFAANPTTTAAPSMPPKSDPNVQAEASRLDAGVSSETVPATQEKRDTEEPEINPLDVQPSEESDEITERGPAVSQISQETPTSVVHGPRFMALPKEEQAMIKRAHQNLCHPSPEQFSALLRQQGARTELQQAVFDLSCPVCATMKKPKNARPSTVKHELDFNDKIFVDGITWTNKSGKNFHFYHIIDQATNYHVAVPAPSRTTENAIRCLSEAWLMWAGAPNMIVTDSATEFLSEAFLNFLQRHDIKPVTTAPYAHWQNGRCERHGDILQHMLSKVDLEYPVETYEDLLQALLQCTNAKNTLSIRRGYSPETLVFGKCSKLPGSICSSEGFSSLASADREDATGIAFRRNLALREKARTAFHQADNDMALRRACLRRSRPKRDAYEAGEWVMMWQPNPKGGHWFGPLKVITQEDQHSVWATQGGKLHRRAPEHIRPVCSHEARQIPIKSSPDTDQSDKIPSNNPLSNTLQRITDQFQDDDNSQETNNPNPMNDHNLNNPLTNSQSDNASQSQEQPDDEPEAITTPNSQSSHEVNNPAINTPIPELEEGDELITTHQRWPC